jgi:hypothetical protein
MAENPSSSRTGSNAASIPSIRGSLTRRDPSRLSLRARQGAGDAVITTATAGQPAFCGPVDGSVDMPEASRCDGVDEIVL